MKYYFFNNLLQGGKLALQDFKFQILSESFLFSTNFWWAEKFHQKRLATSKWHSLWQDELKFFKKIANSMTEFGVLKFWVMFICDQSVNICRVFLLANGVEENSWSAFKIEMNSF